MQVQHKIDWCDTHSRWEDTPRSYGMAHGKMVEVYLTDSARECEEADIVYLSYEYDTDSAELIVAPHHGIPLSSKDEKNWGELDSLFQDGRYGWESLISHYLDTARCEVDVDREGILDRVHAHLDAGSVVEWLSGDRLVVEWLGGTRLATDVHLVDDIAEITYTNISADGEHELERETRCAHRIYAVDTILERILRVKA